MHIYNILIKPFNRHMTMDKASMLSLRYFQLIDMLPMGSMVSRWIHGNKPVGLQREVMGLPFYNPVGLSAGLDIHGELYNDLANLGFSFVEIGPFDANGIRRAVSHIQSHPPKDIIGACISADYLTAFTLAYDFCDFFVIDLSKDFDTDPVDAVLEARLGEQEMKPVVVRLPIHVADNELEPFLNYCMMNNVDAVESCDLDQIRKIHEYTKGRLSIIADNPILTPEEAETTLQAGASLLEVRSGLVYEGPGFVQKILKFLLNKQKNERTGTE